MQAFSGWILYKYKILCIVSRNQKILFFTFRSDWYVLPLERHFTFTLKTKWICSNGGIESDERVLNKNFVRMRESKQILLSILTWKFLCGSRHSIKLRKLGFRFGIAENCDINLFLSFPIHWSGLNFYYLIFNFDSIYKPNPRFDAKTSKYKRNRSQNVLKRKSRFANSNVTLTMIKFEKYLSPN